MNSANYDTETCSIDVLYQIVPIGHLKKMSSIYFEIDTALHVKTVCVIELNSVGRFK